MSDVLRGVARRSVIEVRFLRGAGVSPDPVRIVTAYFDDEGNQLAEHDPYGGLLPTDLTADNSALRGRRDALRHEAGE